MPPKKEKKKKKENKKDPAEIKEDEEAQAREEEHKRLVEQVTELQNSIKTEETLFNQFQQERVSNFATFIIFIILYYSFISNMVLYLLLYKTYNFKERINYFWIVEKKSLEDKKAELRNKEREKQDLEEKQQVEIKIYKQSVKHLLYEHQNEITSLQHGAQITF